MGVAQRKGIIVERSRRSRQPSRERLRVRAPQVTSTPDDPDTSDDEDDDDDDDDVDDEEEEEDTPDNGSNPIVTLTHAPPPQDTTLPPQTSSDSSQVDPTQTNSSQTDSTQTNAPSSSTEATRSIPSTTFLSLTSETSVSEVISTTSTGPGEETATAVPDPGVVGDEAKSGGTNRGADIGIIIGCLALAVLLIVGGAFIYQWYSKRRATAGGLTRPPSSGSDTVGFVPGSQMQSEHAYPSQSEHPGLQRWNSWARFDSRPSAAQGQLSAYTADDSGSELGRPVHDLGNVEPSMPASVYDSYRR